MDRKSWVSIHAIAAMLVIVGCLGGADETESPAGPADEGKGRYAELDSIVFNQLDYVYFISRGEMSTVTFSDAAKAMLTDDTLLFHRDTVYPYGGEPAEATLLRTKYNPKGWQTFIDSENSITCRQLIPGQEGEWLIRIEFEDIRRACSRTSRYTPSTQSLWTTFYQDKGFSFDPNSSIGDYDIGKIRVYYWK